jgi:hypothetical protein
MEPLAEWELELLEGVEPRWFWDGEEWHELPTETKPDYPV